MQSIKNFQSYLFVGSNRAERLKQIEALLKTLGTNLNSNSPDLTIIEPGKDTIGIDRIRELKRTIFQKPSKESFNTVIVKNADRMTTEAQNSLLKLIEEPPQKAIIILEADTRAPFLGTILSRVAVRTSKQTAKLLEIFDFESLQALKEILEIENPKTWLDGQIESHYANLLDNPENAKKQVNLIESLALCKKMISANVNQKFLLANLVFSQI